MDNKKRKRENNQDGNGGRDEVFAPDGDLFPKLRPGLEVVYIQEGHAKHTDHFAADTKNGLRKLDMVHATVVAITSVAENHTQVVLDIHPDDDDYVTGGGEEANRLMISLDRNASEPDFIIPYALYESSIHTAWLKDDEVEQKFDDTWYLGRIHAKLPSVTCWECLQVIWYNEETGEFDPPADGADYDRVSPWEVREPLLDVDARKRRKKLGGEASTSAVESRKADKARRAADKAEAIRSWRAAQAEKARKRKEEEARLAAAAEEAKAAEAAARAAAEAAAKAAAAEAARRAAEAEAAAAAEAAARREEQLREQEAKREAARKAAAERKAQMASMLEKRREAAAEREAREASQRKKQKYRYTMVCASNMNRSMEAHYVLQKKGFNVSSFGTGSQIKIPGPSRDKPNCYEYGTATYKDVYEDLLSKDEELYRRNGMLAMLERNIDTKTMPEKWQHANHADADVQVDVVVCFENRVFEAVLTDLLERGSQTMDPVQVINIETVDNSEAATLGGQVTLKLINEIENIDDLEDDLESVLNKFQKRERTSILHTTAFY
ncbi:RNA polymerase II subunit A domain phosphatase SSU72 [Thecamonas trahens ATCC 50062]|uniref:protein-serine/threonine phosphatase n=1 Tax=Thecamonas trahens ATCC 50062 TaxID=461836 RepID=A0A0L0DSA3_THETB|nr:RNA polymerase II subunit A domain phosphatase SSU72 [Thecamonas trahens ATCC 50062]KNC54916.1 RNA polymerase II subunit A domain phosphatase SSU72 [Thecamonas trahens ATCC 50062]|eukprot:XP_013753506.1 RNA polymerase II subunit A domain phosphatase SSU72 [Thecamonas trahens ATCC 50062]